MKTGWIISVLVVSVSVLCAQEKYVLQQDRIVVPARLGQMTNATFNNAQSQTSCGLIKRKNVLYC